MANALYDKGRQKFLEGNIDWINDTIKVALIDGNDYTEDLANDEFFSDIDASFTGPPVVSAGVALGSKTATDGVADAEDVTFALVSGDQSEILVIYKEVTTPADSPLIAFIDTATGLPVTPNSGDIIVQWSDGANKIFKL